GEFASGKIEDFTLPTSFYKATQKQEIERLLSYSNKQVKERLDKGKKVMKRKEISPSRIEDFYKCPYRAFLSNALKLKPREEGVVDGFSIGNFMHEIFCAYALKTGGISSREESDALVYRISQDLLKKEEYGKFIDDSVTKAMLDRALKECATYCYKNYLALRRSKFKVTKTEATIGKGYDGNPPDYPAILLSDGKVRLTGKIDRVDESDDYFRILDYKTVSPSANIEHLFTGKKLQLYLYANAVRQSVGEKKLAGVYYLSVNERFREDGESDPALSLGVTLDKEQAVKEQDENALKDGESLFFELEKKDGINKIKGATDEQALNCRIEYAKLMAEQAVKLMNDGVIIPSPCDDNICSYCNFRSICSAENPSRKLNVVSDQTIVESVLGGEEECPN
ncbi:MAG: PD-(D/E)XK nuclease family protein, partial [Clostridia bacterium]|nr:PD-(D/E)XK nuclease family protein [Clostridia bacterium]